MGAEQAVLRQRREGGLPVTGLGGQPQGDRDVGDLVAEAGHRGLVLGVDQLDLVGAGEQGRHHRVGVAPAQRLGERADVRRRSGASCAAR